MRIPDIHDLPDQDAYKIYHQRIFDGEEILSEAKILRSEGVKIDTEFNNKCVSITGRLYMHTTARNVTERKKAEEVLRLEKENFRHSLDDSPLGVRIATLEGNTIYANKTLLNYYGYDSLDELQKTSLKDRYTPESYTRAQERKRQRESGDLSATRYEVSIVRKNGEIRHLQVFRKEVLWDGIRQFQILYDDITERKRAEETIRNLAKFPSENPDPVLRIDMNGNLLYVNEACHKLLTWELQIGEKTPLVLQKIIAEAMKEGIRKIIDTKHDQRIISFIIIPVVEAGYANLYGRDITERKQAEEEIRKSKKLLEDLHKHLEEIRENERALISREIHDQIGQSLTALKLDLNWMHKYVNTNPEATAKLKDMIELATNTIKDVQRISSGLRPGILDDLGLVSAIEWYCDEFEKRTGIKCILKLDTSDYGDSQINLSLFRVLQETLTNVIRHANASSVTIKLHQTQKGTTLAIMDNGIGITSEKVESAKSLGLIGMRERVRQFGGKVSISSRKGQGTRLTIFIPDK
jgi:PAS domain S-box-containing protein